jgi:hypothetical protein
VFVVVSLRVRCSLSFLDTYFVMIMIIHYQLYLSRFPSFCALCSSVYIIHARSLSCHAVLQNTCSMQFSQPCVIIIVITIINKRVCIEPCQLPSQVTFLYLSSLSLLTLLMIGLMTIQFIINKYKIVAGEMYSM